MIKLFYKTLLITLVSGSLMTMNLEAYAQATAPMSAATSPDVKRDANGVLTKTDSYDFKGTQQKDNMLNSITMLVVGAVGMKILMYKKKTVDMLVAGAASAAYIAAEVMNIINAKKQLQDSSVLITSSSDGSNSQTQIDSLQKLKKSYQDAKSSGKTRKMLQLAAAAGFGVATGIGAGQSHLNFKKGRILSANCGPA